MTDWNDAEAGGVAGGDEGLAAAWEDLPREPDPERHLDYALADWEVVKEPNESGQLVFLPMDESLLREDAFIVAAEDDCLDLHARR